MKFLHIADLHFGKTLYEKSLAEDQKFWMQEFLKVIKEQEVKAVLISGDIYDRKDPSEEAVYLFNDFITQLSKEKVYVLVIPGNHDSAIRLSQAKELLKIHNIYIANRIKKQLDCISISDEKLSVNFWLMPFVFPEMVSDELEEKYRTYTEAVKALLAVQNIDKKACNVILAHQNVLNNGKQPEHSDSESFSGGLGGIDYKAFDDFDYVALGHIHNAQHIGRETLRYAGCPLYYDFSEVNRKKPLTMVTINSKEDIQIEKIEIPLLHQLKTFEGTVEELLKTGQAIENKEKYYFKCIITDKDIPVNSIDKLRGVYGENLLNIEKAKNMQFAANANQNTKNEDFSKKNILEQFAEFSLEVSDTNIGNEQKSILENILRQQENAGNFQTNRQAEEALSKDSEALLITLLENFSRL